MFDLNVRLFLSVLLTLAIKGVVAWSGHSIAWIWAALIAVAVVFVGWLILSGDVID